MSDLLKEAIADAKAVRETALQNAKMALEEAFTPHLKSMLSAKLSEEDEEVEDEEFDVEVEDEEEEVEAEEGYGENAREEDDDEEEVDESEIVEIDGVKYAPIVSEEEEDDEEDEEGGEELDLEAVIKELEQELEESEDSDIVEGEEDDAETEETDDLEESTEEDDSEEKVTEEVEDDSEEKVTEEVEETNEATATLEAELKEYKEAVAFLRDKLHEVNILNAKLLYTNRLFKEFVLSNDQKLKIVETFDRAQTTREIKLVYSTLAESYKDTGDIKKNEVVKEFASKKSGGTAPKTKIISEESQVADRFKKLAGILND